MGGAVSIIFAPYRIHQEKNVNTIRLLRDQLSSIKSDGRELETEILSIITHRTNLPLSWQHISPELVNDHNRRRELYLRRQEAKQTGDNAEYIVLLEKVNQEQEDFTIKLQDENRELQNRNQQLENDNDNIRDENRQMSYRLDSLTTSLAAKETDTNMMEQNPLSLIKSFSNFISNKATPEDTIKMVEHFYPQNLTVLESAWKSAEKSSNFKECKQLLDLLVKLVTDYRDMLIDGKGDAQAKDVFGKNFAAKESETVMKNQNARRLRTFPYRGENIEMVRHLKIGIKDSPAETIRVHFHWDVTHEKVVIGYCGPHLDFQ